MDAVHCDCCCCTAFHLFNSEYIWTADVQCHHHNTQVLYNSLICYLLSTSAHSHTVVRYSSRVRRPHA